jgi:hypothetical protein
MLEFLSVNVWNEVAFDIMTSDRLIFLVHPVETCMCYCSAPPARKDVTYRVNEINIQSEDQHLQLEGTAFVVY